jgi:hypothetical protein
LTSSEGVICGKLQSGHAVTLEFCDMYHICLIHLSHHHTLTCEMPAFGFHKSHLGHMCTLNALNCLTAAANQFLDHRP